MKNIVLCFDRARDHPGPRDATNAEALLRLLDESDEQITWYHPGTRMPASGAGMSARLRWRSAAVQDARATIAQAYEFLVDWWEPGDRIYIFGVGRGAYCAHALTRLLGTVGVLPDLMDYVLAAYALPRTHRSPQDWRRVALVAARLAGKPEIGVPVEFLGLWDMVKVPGSRATDEPLGNVVSGRHAVAVDGRHGPRHLVSSPDCVEEVWFRGAHCDVAGGPGACWPLADIALDWMLDGAVQAGIAVRARQPDASRRLRANTTRSPAAHARCRCAGRPPARWCTPASTSTCGRIRSTGGGCPLTSCGPTPTGSPAANVWCTAEPPAGAGRTRGVRRRRVLKRVS